MALFQFIKSLTPSELSVIKPTPRKRIQRKNVSQSQVGKLLDIVIRTPLEELNDECVQKMLPDAVSDENYSKLKSRVQTIIIDKICSDKFLRNDEIIRGTERAEVRIRKKLLAIQVLWLKTAKSDKKLLLRLLNEVIEEAKEYELYDGLLEALTIKQYFFAARSGASEYLKVKDEIEFYKQCSQAKREANNYYFELVVCSKLISPFSEKELGILINEKVKVLEASPFTTVSRYVQYYYKVLLLAQQQKDRKFAESIDICLELVNLLNRSKALARAERYGFVYGNLSQCLIYQREFTQAAQTARAAQVYFPVESLSYVLIAEQEFFACFYSRNYKRCREVLQHITEFNKTDTGQLRLDTFTYYLACLEFAEGDFKQVKFLLNLSLSITKDKARWDLGIRYLKIMTLIELGAYEDARDAIEALRKKIERNSAEGKIEISARDGLIYRLFNEMALLQFKASNPRLDYFLKRLGLKGSEFGWKFFTHEIIPVHRWARAKTEIHKRKNRALK